MEKELIDKAFNDIKTLMGIILFLYIIKIDLKNID